MRSRIVGSASAESIPDTLMQVLPYRLSDAIRRELKPDVICEEIRIRQGRMSALSLSGGEDLFLDVSLSPSEMETLVEKLCGGSLYAHKDTICKGYIVLPGGLRAGVSGRAAVENGRVIGVSHITGICIRLPHHINVDTSPVLRLLREFDYAKGVLIYSPPGVGKTTLLRGIAAELSRGQNGLRVAVVDSRGELEFGLRARYITADILSLYPKAVGMEIALRTLGARLIICDEIGGDDETEPMIAASTGGVGLVASAHARSVGELLAKKSIAAMHGAGVFGAYVGITRRGREYEYEITYRDGAESIKC